MLRRSVLDHRGGAPSSNPVRALGRVAEVSCRLRPDGAIWSRQDATEQEGHARFLLRRGALNW
jgi:hypothetical protein